MNDKFELCVCDNPMSVFLYALKASESNAGMFDKRPSSNGYMLKHRDRPSNRVWRHWQTLRTILFFRKSANRTEKAILDAITMKMNIIPALEYLRDVGFEMSERKYFSHQKKSLKNQTRMNLLIAKHFQEQYLENLTD